MIRQRIPLAAVPLMLVVIASACAPPETDSTTPAKIRNPELGIALAALPPGFRVDENAGDQLVLELPAETEGERPGRAWIELGEVASGGINLVDIVNSQKGIFEAKPGGEFFGSRELVTQLGPAYYSRGRYDEAEGVRLEEIRVFQLHPTENRLLTVHYRYPAAEDSAARLEQALILVGELEPLEDPGAAMSEPGA